MEPHGTENIKSRAFRAGVSTPTVWARVLTSVAGLAEGYDLSSIGSALVLIKADIDMTPRQVGFVVGILYFAMALGAPIGGTLADRVGRKPALATTFVVLIVGAVCMSLAVSFQSLLFGRILTGAGIGAGLTVTTTYIAEVSPTSHRGQYVSLEDLFIVVGITMGYLVGGMFAGTPHDWRWILGVGAVPAAAALLLLPCPQLLESPRWNMLHGEKDRAMEDLEKLVGKQEASHMLEQWGLQEECACTWGEALCPAGRWRQRALVAGCGVIVSQMLTGMQIVTTYTHYILVQDFEKDEAYLITSVMGCLRVVSLIVVVFWMLDTAGRRPLMLVSLGGCAAASICVSTCYMFGAAAALKAAGIVAFSLSFTIGMGPVAFVYPAEVFSTDARSKSVAVGVFLARMAAGCMAAGFPVLQAYAGIPLCFMLLAGLNAASFAFVWLYAPETLGSSLEEMHRLFRRAGEP